MKKTDIKKSIDNYINFVDSESMISTNVVKDLMVLLDSLGLSQANSDYIFDKTDYPDPPDENYEHIKERVKNIFPDFGFYNQSEDIIENISEAKIIVGDAIDDIVDIYIDLKVTKWRWENTSIDYSLWFYNFSYSSHWGSHLRNLQLYLFNYQYR